ncbi:MAG TPA: DUF1573 domain-containing protein [Gemmataceae bacterium]|nr:DUF1573 domain-containing protein [Gemmataceae bacterium]
MRRMPLVLTATLLALFANPARADLSFATPTIDVGEVRSGAPLRQRFTFVNAGSGAVEITDLRASCGCVRPKLDKRSYAPGDEGAVLLEVHTLGQSAGEHDWRLHVTYHSGAEAREVELVLHGRIVTEVTVQPAVLTIFTERAAAHEMALTDLRARPLTVTGVYASSPHLKGEVKETTTDGAGHRVVRIGLSLGAAYPEGRYEETVAILTDDAVYRELTVPLTVVKRPKQKVAASPGAVSLAAARGQPVPSRIVLLRPAGEEAVAVESVEADDPAVVCTWAAGPENCATLKVGIDRTKLPADGLRSAIHIHISKPAPDTITLPVTCRVE